MKKRFILTESDIKAVMAEKFKVNPNDVTIWVETSENDRPGLIASYMVTIEIESEVQNYDL